MPTLSITNLHAGIGQNQILRGVNLAVRPGETHAIMGPNGSGKSTLSQIILHHPRITVSRGKLRYGRTDLLAASPDQIARTGIILGFQNPQVISGVSLTNLLAVARSAFPRRSKAPARELLAELQGKARALHVEKEFISRGLNEGFSGGEKKKSEIMQIALLRPKLAILDEIDSGLDVDALKLVAGELRRLQAAKVSILLITHYPRILKFVKPDKVHVMVKGRIAASGGAELIRKIDASGYGQWTKMQG